MLTDVHLQQNTVFDVRCSVTLDSTDKVKEIGFNLMYKDLS